VSLAKFLFAPLADFESSLTGWCSLILVPPSFFSFSTSLNPHLTSKRPFALHNYYFVQKSANFPFSPPLYSFPRVFLVLSAFTFFHPSPPFRRLRDTCGERFFHSIPPTQILCVEFPLFLNCVLTPSLPSHPFCLDIPPFSEDISQKSSPPDPATLLFPAPPHPTLLRVLPG